MKSSSQDTQFAEQSLKPGHAEQEEWFLTNRPRRSVFQQYYSNKVW
jgi:hypothetical protein